ncbi:ABC transporter permease [Anaerolentibacter hominis]|uniref:ABC transporter permease n=1 Tax=Anaerolentibacter hominis TaxID=3079009 RepID=UPI0031B879F1
MWDQIVAYFTSNMGAYLAALGAHIRISLLTLAAALLIGIPLGFFCAARKRAGTWVSGFFQVLKIVPSLAVLILLIPIMGTGQIPAMTALILLAVPPVLMNTAVGYEEVPDFMLETAKSLGMTRRQVFWKVRVPMSFPSIFTGAKSAFVEIIASATLAAYIGGGGLGTIIFTGLGLNRTDLLLIGGGSVAVLSILAGVMLGAVQKKIVRYRVQK